MNDKTLVAAQEIVNVLYSDSRIILDVNEVAEILQGDVNINEVELPTSDEISILVCGDEDGVISDDLKMRYPDTYNFLAEQF